MASRINHTSIIVRDQEEAIAFYTKKMGFEPRDRAPMGPDLYWVTVGLPGDSTEVILETPAWQAEKETLRKQLIGNQSLLITTDDCAALHEDWKAKGVDISEPPTEQPYGIQLIAHDLDGNMIVAVQQRTSDC